MEKYGTARQVTDDNKIERMLSVCWINKATDTHKIYNKGKVKAKGKVSPLQARCGPESG